MSDLYTSRERVAIGVRFLDEVMPDWRSIINVESLRMNSSDACVLGQLFGWQKGVEVLYEWSITQDWSDLPAYMREDEQPAEIAGFERDWNGFYAELHDEWLRVIADEPECDGCDQDPWRKPVHYGTCPLNNERQPA